MSDKQAQQWQPYQFPDLELHCVATLELPTFDHMPAGILYRMESCRLVPASVMVFKSAEDELTAIQLTCSHDDAEAEQSRARQLLWQQTLQQLQLPSHVRSRLLMVPDPKHAEQFAQQETSSSLSSSSLVLPSNEQQHNMEIATLRLCWPDR